jgi:hypothetical protein
LAFKGAMKRKRKYLRPIVVEILLLIFHQQKIGTESGEEMMR